MNKEIEQYARTLQFRSDNGERYFFDITAGKESADENVLSEHSNRKSTGAKRFLALVEEAANSGNKFLMVNEFQTTLSNDYLATRTFNITKQKTSKSKPKPNENTQLVVVNQKQQTQQSFVGFGAIEQFYGGLQGFLADKTAINDISSDLKFALREKESLEKELDKLEKKCEKLECKIEIIESENTEHEKTIGSLESKSSYGNIISSALSGLVLKSPKLRGFLGLEGDDEPQSQAIEGNSVQTQNQAQITSTMPPNTTNDADYDMKTRFVQSIANFIVGVPKEDFLQLYHVIHFCTINKENLMLIYDLTKTNETK